MNNTDLGITCADSYSFININSYIKDWSSMTLDTSESSISSTSRTFPSYVVANASAASMSYSPKPQTKQPTFVMDWAWDHGFSSSRPTN